MTSAPGLAGLGDRQGLFTISGTGTIVGTECDDVICGGPGDDRIAGLGGNDILLGFGGNDHRTSKTGHVAGMFAAVPSSGSYAPIAGCTSCHDQTDSANTVAGNFTFPHGQVAAGASNLTTDGINTVPAGSGVRSRIWAGYSGSVGAPLTFTAGTNQKAYDGQCLKCHRDGAGNGIGLTK